MKKLYSIEDGSYPENKNQNTEFKFWGNGWSVEEIDSVYFLEFISASQGGSLEKRIISKECYEKARLGNLTLQEILAKVTDG